MTSETAVAPEEAPPRERLLDPWLLSVAVLWGLNAVPTKWALTVMEPAGILLFRYVVCALILGAAAWRQHRSRGANGPTPWGMMLLVGAWVSVQQLIFMYAFDWTSASEASLIISIAPIWTALIGAARKTEVITLANWLGILGAGAGVALIVFGGTGLDAELPARVKGDLWMIASSLGYGSYMAYSKGIMNRYGSLQVMSWSFVFGCLLVVPAGLGQFIHADWEHVHLLHWGSLLFTALIAGGYGFVVWYRTLARTAPSKTAVYQYLVPVVSLVAAAVLLGERMTAQQVVGALIVLTGLVLARKVRPNAG